MKTQDTHTISLLVANKPGVLVRVALVFARRGYNIDSLAVSAVHNPKFSRMTITAKGDPATLEQIIKQVKKLIDVIQASEHDPALAVDQEMSLLKVKPSTPANKAVIVKHARAAHAKLLDETDGVLIFAHAGTSSSLDELEKVMNTYGLLEMARTGKLLMMKGKETT